VWGDRGKGTDIHRRSSNGRISKFRGRERKVDKKRQKLENDRKFRLDCKSSLPIKAGCDRNGEKSDLKRAGRLKLKENSDVHGLVRRLTFEKMLQVGLWVWWRGGKKVILAAQETVERPLYGFRAKLLGSGYSGSLFARKSELRRSSPLQISFKWLKRWENFTPERTRS